MDPNRINSPTIFNEAVTFAGTVNHKTASVKNEHIGADAAAPIDAEKLEQQIVVGHSSPIGSAVTAWSEIVHIAQGAGELVDVEVVVDTVPTGDNTLTIDVELWAGSAWTSLLDADEVVDSGYTAKTPVVVALATAHTYADGNLIRITGTLGGGSGNHAQGVRVQARLREKP